MHGFSKGDCMKFISLATHPHLPFVFSFNLFKHKRAIVFHQGVLWTWRTQGRPRGKGARKAPEIVVENEFFLAHCFVALYGKLCLRWRPWLWLQRLIPASSELSQLSSWCLSLNQRSSKSSHRLWPRSPSCSLGFWCQLAQRQVLGPEMLYVSAHHVAWELDIQGINVISPMLICSGFCFWCLGLNLKPHACWAHALPVSYTSGPNMFNFIGLIRVDGLICGFAHTILGWLHHLFLNTSMSQGWKSHQSFHLAEWWPVCHLGMSLN